MPSIIALARQLGDFLAHHTPADQSQPGDYAFDATSDAWKHFCDKLP